MRHNVADFHLHLNGSYPVSFLEKCANDSLTGDAVETEATKAFALFLKNAAEIMELQKLNGDVSEIVKKIFLQFSYIYSIVKVSHIVGGVRAVVESSSASYLEIRNTPKKNEDGSINYESIDKFVEGLSQDYDSKEVWGVLGINRTESDLASAKEVVDIVTANKKLVAIDISGNPMAPRTLTGKDLTDLIAYAIDKNVGVTVHAGEVDSAVERQEVDNILTFLESRDDTKTAEARRENAIIVRLGHCRYLSPEFKSRIRKLGLPVEYTQTCYETLRWPLGVAGLFSQPVDVLSGTDDSLLFGCNARDEMLAARGQVSASEFADDFTQMQINTHGFRPVR